MKYKLTKTNFDMQAGTIWYDAGLAVPHPGQGESRVVTEIEGDKTEGALRIVPVEKLEQI
jgi:hypothetical protein